MQIGLSLKHAFIVASRCSLFFHTFTFQVRYFSFSTIKKQANVVHPQTKRRNNHQLVSFDRSNNNGSIDVKWMGLFLR